MRKSPKKKKVFFSGFFLIITAGIMSVLLYGLTIPSTETTTQTEASITDQNDGIINNIPLPSNLPNPTSSELRNIGLLDVTSSPYNADPSGKTDSTNAIQEAVDYAHQNQLVVFFPQGTYLISDTVFMLQRNDLYRFPHKYAHYLVGSNKNGERPIIKLKANSPGYNGKEVKSMFFFQAVCDPNVDGKNCRATEELPEGLSATPGRHMSSGLSNIDFQIESGNSKAAAINCEGSQNSVMKNIKIESSGGFTGLYNYSGVLSVMSNIEIYGGQYGIYGPSTKSGAFNNIKLIDQTKYAIANSTPSPWPTGFVGFEIVKENAPVIQTVNGYQPGSGNLSFHDGTIEVKNSNGQPLIDNVSGSSVVLQNVYVKGNTNVAKSPNDNLTVPSKEWYNISEYVVTDSGNSSGKHKSIVIKGISKSEQVEKGPIKAKEPNKEFLWSKHYWTYDPWTPDVLLALSKVNQKVCLATDHSKINGNDDKEDSTGLQELANRCEILLLPKGNFLLSKTLDFNKNIEFVGIANHLSNIFEHSSFNPASPSAMLRTADSADAMIRLFDFGIRFPNSKENPNIFGLHWRSGVYSIANNIYLMHFWVPEDKLATNEKTISFLASGNAGGKIYAVPGPSGADYNKPNEHLDTRNIKIEGTSSPLQLYNPNPEDNAMGYYYPDQSTQMEITNSKNVAIYGAKAENWVPYTVSKSSNVLITALGGSNRLLVKDSNDIVLYNSSPKTDGSESYEKLLFGIRIFENEKTLLDVNTNNPVNQSITISMYKNGSFDDTPFDILAIEAGKPVPPPCTPQCDGKECGGDSCGGSCGVCTNGFSCNSSGQCETVDQQCTPDCDGKECGGDECGGSCGICNTGFSCSSSGQCLVDQAECKPSCNDRSCGDDGCGGLCGVCSTGYLCSIDGQCVVSSNTITDPNDDDRDPISSIDNTQQETNEPTTSTTNTPPTINPPSSSSSTNSPSPSTDMTSTISTTTSSSNNYTQNGYLSNQYSPTDGQLPNTAIGEKVMIILASIFIIIGLITLYPSDRSILSKGGKKESFRNIVDNY